MTCNFRVGQKVVCVNDENLPYLALRGPDFFIQGLHGLTRGAVYTVREVYSAPYCATHLVKLEEITRPAADDGYSVARFRPVVEPGTEKGMSILRNILNKTDKPVEVDA